MNLASTIDENQSLAPLVLTCQPPVFGRISQDPSGDGSGPFDVAFNNGNPSILIPVADEDQGGPHLLEITDPDDMTETTYSGQAVRPTDRSESGANDGLVIGVYKATNPVTDVTVELLLVRTFGAAPFYYQIAPMNVTILKGR